jgi:hypothetical protein
LLKQVSVFLHRCRDQLLELNSFIFIVLACSSWTSCSSCISRDGCIWCASEKDLKCVSGGFSGLLSRNDCSESSEYYWKQCSIPQTIVIYVIIIIATVFVILIVLMVICCLRPGFKKQRKLDASIIMAPYPAPSRRRPWWRPQNSSQNEQDRPPAYESHTTSYNLDAQKQGSQSPAAVRSNRARDQVLARLAESGIESPYMEHAQNKLPN